MACMIAFCPENAACLTCMDNMSVVCTTPPVKMHKNIKLKKKVLVKDLPQAFFRPRPPCYHSRSRLQFECDTYCICVEGKYDRCT
ncbi:hypothetical protein HanHA300_Chr03g0096111 [Helianthus annuus]|nr:hypothetical protein HanHA300_Chr03g0096111 [Helianthus annuus]KAJ0608370.1 hypothetical protein HanHA89_Chr03g0107801 [Helianthus annuus]KAJ0768434.1 hypothetical protein HanLR1_Chr03g0101171 [Helianthus annuus]